MRIESLQLRQFRNFEWLQLAFRPRINFLLGDNGQGKTNLLEAIHLLCRGSSFRAAESRSLLRRSGQEPAAQEAKIDGHFLRGDLDYHVEMRLTPGRRSAQINGKPANSATLMSHFPIVLFSPESLAAIKEGPDERRQLIDELLINHDPRQARILREFARASKSRNRLLKNLSEGVGNHAGQRASLDSLNKIYLILATHLTTARIRALNDLLMDIQEAMRSILDEPSADISVDYVMSGASALSYSESQVYDALRIRLQELGPQEIASGAGLVGPQKHDIKLLFAGNDSRFYCSQGQQRALILALKIAQIVYHHRVHQTYPVLLLDDVMSELDAKKRVNLMKFLEGISAQILITGTDLTWPEQFGFDRNSVFSVAEGRIGVAHATDAW